MNHSVRSLIFAIDNRATEMGRDFDLPVIQRDDVETQLRDWIHGEKETKLNLPWDNIALWKKQFDRKD